MMKRMTSRQNDFVQEAGKQFRDLGFSRDEPQALSRRVDLGGQYIHFSFTETVLKIKITVHIGISCYAVENRLAELKGNPCASGASRAGTLGVDLGHLMQKKPPVWAILHDSVTAETCTDIVLAFKNSGLPILNRIATLQDVFLALSSGHSASSEQALGNPTELGRAERAIVVSYLLDNDLFDATRRAELLKLGKSLEREAFVLLANKLNRQNS